MGRVMGSKHWGLSLVMGLALAGCGAEEPQLATQQAELVHSAGGHIMPVRMPGEVQSNAIKAAASPQLTYHGGKVISNVRVVQVLYGNGTYLSNVSSTTAPSMASFYQNVTNSNYVDWLTEYNTPSQTIGRGSFQSQVRITPASTRNRTTITDAQIETELNAQINSGVLPAPTANTIYMIDFPKGKKINLGGTNSCVAGGFCAYHSTFTRSDGTEVFYGVLPDMSAGSGCDTGCGGSTQFNNQTSVASHELIEAVTDAEVGLATVIGPPLAWYDPNNGEIGDICNGEQGTFVGGDGRTYTIQLEWSNQANACIAHK